MPKCYRDFMKQGILIGADRSAEKLIPWWWKNYSRHSSLPVAIVDFGMTQKRLEWCKKRMQVLSLTDTIVLFTKDQIFPSDVKEWHQEYKGPLWQARSAWFKKPMACLLSPFDLTLWLDIDCEVCSSLDDLFNEFQGEIDLAICREVFRPQKGTIYNSGVMLFRKNSPFLRHWDQLCRQMNGVKMGDQDVLTEIVLQEKIPFKELSPFYNWVMYAGYHPGIVIAHWVSGWGKEYIKKFGGINKLLCCHK